VTDGLPRSRKGGRGEISDSGTEFREVFIASVEEGLASIGENFKRVILFHVNQRSSLTLNDVPEKPQEFMMVINGVLGEGVVRVIERVIAKRLYEKLGIPFSVKPGYGLADYAQEARTQYKSRQGAAGQGRA
jgi:hypothetical protein